MLLPLILIAAAAAQPSWRERDPVSVAAPGRVDVQSRVESSRLPPAGRTALLNKGVKLRDMLLATPALSDPHGFALGAGATLKARLSTETALPEVVEGYVLLRFINVQRAKPDAKGRYGGDGEGPQIHFYINKLNVGLSSTDSFDLPEALETRGGVTLFKDNWDDVIIIHKPGVLPYRPFTMADRLAYEAARLERSVSESQRPQDPTNLDLAAKAAELRRQVAALSPEERRKPLCLRYQKPAPCNGDSRPQYIMNDAYFDKTKPLSAAQVIALRVQYRNYNAQNVPLRQAAGQLDLNAVRALLD